MDGILCKFFCDIRPDCHNSFDARGTLNVMFDKLAKRSLVSRLAGMKHAYVAGLS